MQVDLRTHIHGTALDVAPDDTDRFASDRLGRCANAQLDLLRIETLLKHGGAFFDLDVYVLDNAKLHAWRTCGKPTAPGPASAVVGSDASRSNHIDGGVLLAAPQSRFLKAWKASFKTYNAKTWDYGACNQSTVVAEAMGPSEVIKANALGPLPRYSSRALYDAHISAAPLAHLSAFRHPWRLHDVMTARHLEHIWNIIKRAINESAPADDIAHTDSEVKQCLAQIAGACWATPGKKCGIYGA